MTQTAPITEADENSSIRDAVGILSGLLMALVFIAGSSFEIRYITSAPSQLLVPGQVVGIATKDGLNAPITQVEGDRCSKKIGDRLTLEGPKSLLSYYQGENGGNALLAPIDLPDDLKCVKQISVPSSRVTDSVQRKA